MDRRMSLQSMTGFARADGSDGVVTWAWELRSVNGRGLDVRFRLPPGYEALEAPAREAISKVLARGSVTASLNAQRQTAATQIRINETALEQVLKAAEHLHRLTGCEQPRAEGLLALKGVLEVAEDTEDPAASEPRRAAMLASLATAIAGLVSAREGEGRRLAAVLSAQIDEIERLTRLVSGSPSRSVEAIRRRLAEQVGRLLEASPALDEQRLHQEAVLLATKADVEEELKRLEAHVEQARELLGVGKAVGRKLDFLSQEFNREANTLCSKANAVEITRAGLALKAVIDQLREQIQNIE